MEATIWVPALSAVIAAALSSAGLWAFLQKRLTGQNAMTRVLMGLAYDKITSLGMSYIDRGWITKDEFEDLQNYYYAPYKEMGGNGVAEQVMNQVKNLPFNQPRLYFELSKPRQDSREYQNDRWAAPSNTRHAIEQPRV